MPILQPEAIAALRSQLDDRLRQTRHNYHHTPSPRPDQAAAIDRSLL